MICINIFLGTYLTPPWALRPSFELVDLQQARDVLGTQNQRPKPGIFAAYRGFILPSYLGIKILVKPPEAIRISMAFMECHKGF